MLPLPIPIHTHETANGLPGTPQGHAEPTGPAAFDLDTALARNVSPVRSPGLVTRIWHWRSVLLVGAGTPAGLLALAEATHPAAAVGVVLSTALGFATSRAARQWAKRRIWGVVVPHRLRAAFVQARVCNRRGQPPVVLFALSGVGGVRVWLWCRRGIEPGQLLAAREVLMTMCFAVALHVERHERFRQLVVLNIGHQPTDGRADP